MSNYGVVTKENINIKCFSMLSATERNFMSVSYSLFSTFYLRHTLVLFFLALYEN